MRRGTARLLLRRHGDTQPFPVPGSVGVERAFLRAERAGNGPGRIYTLRYMAIDSSGNSRTITGSVTVPRDLESRPVATPARRNPESKRPLAVAEPGKRQ